MPRIIDIQPKDIYVLFEMSIMELKKLHKAMEMSNVNYDGTKSEEAEAAEYFNEFWEFLEELLKEKINGT